MLTAAAIHKNARPCFTIVKIDIPAAVPVPVERGPAHPSATKVQLAPHLAGPLFWPGMMTWRWRPSAPAPASRPGPSGGAAPGGAAGKEAHMSAPLVKCQVLLQLFPKNIVFELHLIE